MRRIGLVGLGAAAHHIHIPACKGLVGATLAAGCDPAPRGERLGFPVYESLPQMLQREQLDLVIIATPTESHFELARLCLEAGRHVLCEKPFTTTIDEAVRLVLLARERGLRIAVNNEFRFMRCHAAARALVGSARFGELLFVQMNQTFRTSAQTEAGWRGEDPERTCKEFGTHVFDLARFFFGCEPEELYAHMPRPAKGTGPDMLNLIDLRFPGDRWARITLDRLTRGRHRYLDVRLDGTVATVETELGGHVSIALGLHATSRRPYLDADISMGGRAYAVEGERRRKLAADPLALFAHATRALLQAFVSALDQGRAPPCEGRDNLRTFALMRAAYEAAGASGRVDLGFLAELP